MSKRRLAISLKDLKDQSSSKKSSPSAPKNIEKVIVKSEIDNINFVDSTEQSISESNLGMELSKWAKKCYISPVAMDDLLTNLKSWHPELPSTYRELQRYSEAQGELPNFDDDYKMPKKENTKLSERLDRLEDMFEELTNKVAALTDTLEQQGFDQVDFQDDKANKSLVVLKSKKYSLKIDSKDELLDFDLKLETDDKAREELVNYLLGLGQFKTVGFYIAAIFKAIFTREFLAQCRWNSLIPLKETELARIIICVVMQVFDGNTERRIIDTISGVLRQFAMHNKKRIQKLEETEINVAVANVVE